MICGRRLRMLVADLGPSDQVEIAWARLQIPNVLVHSVSLNLLHSLPSEELKMLELHYGIDGGQPMTFGEMAAVYVSPHTGRYVTRGWMSQLTKQALRRLGNLQLMQSNSRALLEHALRLAARKPPDYER